MSGLPLLLAAALLRISIGTSGHFEVSAAALSGKGVDVASSNLYAWDGVSETAVPILVRADGGFEFLGAVRTRHSPRTTFILRPRAPGEAPARCGERSALPAPARALRIAWNRTYDPCTTGERAALDSFGYGGCNYFFFGPPRDVQELPLAFPPVELAGGAVATLALALQGERKLGASNGVDVLVNGKRTGKTLRWAGPREKVLRVEVPASELLDAHPALRLEARDGSVRVDWIELEGGRPSTSTPRAPLGVEATDPADLETGGADWLAIAVDGCAEALAPLAAHRGAQGLKSRIVRLRDVFDRFSAGNFDPRAIRAFLAHARSAWKPAPRYVLLVGDATYDVEGLREEPVLPAALVDTYDNGASATDNWYAAFDEERVVPSLAIGRFPTSSAREVRTLVERTIRYETRAPAGPWRRRISFAAGEGQSALISAQAAQVIEQMATRLLTEYVPQGYELSMTYASATSPYYYPPARFADKVVERLNEGAAIVSYIGHGSPDGFESGGATRSFSSDDVPRVRCGEMRPIVFVSACWTGFFDNPEGDAVCERLFKHDAGPAAIVASSRISHPFANGILSKELVHGLFSDEAGPRRLGDALVRTKHLMLEGKDPYRDMINGYGLLFLGDPLLLLRLVKDDIQLYNLFGDPALELPFPRGAVALEPKGPLVPGKTLSLAGRAEGVDDGEAIVTLEVDRKDIRGEIVPLEPEKPGLEARILKNYETANAKVVVRESVRVHAGRFEARILVPKDVKPARHWLKAFAWNERAQASGAQPVEVSGP